MGNETASPSTWVVNRGIDTLVVNAFYTDNGKPIKLDMAPLLAEQLDEWKRSAQAVSEPIVTDWTFNRSALLMHPNGAGGGQWQWLLKTPDITLYLSGGKWNGVASVRFNAQYLWSCHNALEAIAAVHVFLRDILHDEVYLQLSEVHLCADVVGWHGVEQLNQQRDFVSRSRKRGTHFEPDWGFDAKAEKYAYGLHSSGFDFSKRGAMSCTIYDKTREIQHSGKEWFYDLWRSRGWDETTGGPVWRVEFKFKREVLHELEQEGMFHGIEDVYELPGRLPLLWAYAAGHVGGDEQGIPDGWLRCVVPSEERDKNRTRWPTHPAWHIIQGAFSEPAEQPEHFGKIVRKRWRERNIDKGIEAMIGYATSLASWVGDEFIADSGIALWDSDLSDFLQWFAQAGQAYLDRKELHFGMEVLRKQTKFGVEVSV
ncbi:MAG: hypothetical protein ACYDER_18815 [Ktedonobacteraceae bacterium]